MKSVYRGMAASFLIFITSYLGSILWMGPWLWLLRVYPSHFRYFMDSMGSSWFYFLVFVIERVAGVKVRVSGPPPQRGERALLLLNHRTRLDWVWIWSPLVRKDCAHFLKIILKDSLKRVPGLGWAMQTVVFLFITRRWEQDQNYLKRALRYMKVMKCPTQILLFPEGTDLTRNSKQRSDDFARKNNLPLYEHVLHPRATGFANILSYLQHETGLDSIYDVTIAYPDILPQTELDFLSGKFPSEVHILFERFEASVLPRTANLDINESELEVMSQWLNARWSAKEERLRHFYSEKVVHLRSLLRTDEVVGTVLLDKQSCWLCANALLWFVFLFIAIYFICTSWLAFFLFIFINGLYIYCTWKGGLDTLVVSNILDT